MLVEDEVITGLAVADVIKDVGYAVAGPFVRTATAADWLERNTPDVAILDVVLADGSCAGIARMLRTRGVPFLVYSGWSYRDDVRGDFQGAPWLEKPAASQEIATTLTLLAGSRPAAA
jgi:DNA-binding response OmpR family regulator